MMCRYFPGHIHAFYLEYIYYHRKNMAASGLTWTKPATGVYSDKIQNGGHHHRPAAAVPAQPAQPAQPGYAAPYNAPPGGYNAPPGGTTYGTV